MLFGCYDLVYYHLPDALFPYQKCEMGQLLSIADNCTGELTFIILPMFGNIVISKSVWGVPPKTSDTDAVKADILELDSAIHHCFGNHILAKSSRCLQFWN